MTTLLPQAATEVTPPRTFPELAGHVRLLEAELIGRVMAAIRTRPTYSSLDERDLRPTVARHVRTMLEHFAAGGSIGAEDLAFFRHMGEQRARHATPRVDDWLLIDLRSPAGNGGRMLGIADIYSRDGEILCTVAQLGAVRTPD